jgi:hypothetical protein
MGVAWHLGTSLLLDQQPHRRARSAVWKNGTGLAYESLSLLNRGSCVISVGEQNEESEAFDIDTVQIEYHQAVAFVFSPVF